MNRDLTTAMRVAVGCCGTSAMIVAIASVLAVPPAMANVRSQALYARGLVPFNNGQCRRRWWRTTRRLS